MLLHLEAGIDGEDVTVLQGLAELSAEPAAAWMDRIGAPYGLKYAEGLASLNLTTATMAEQFSTVIRIVPTKLTAW